MRTVRKQIAILQGLRALTGLNHLPTWHSRSVFSDIHGYQQRRLGLGTAQPQNIDMGHSRSDGHRVPGSLPQHYQDGQLALPVLRTTPLPPAFTTPLPHMANILHTLRRKRKISSEQLFGQANTQRVKWASLPQHLCSRIIKLSCQSDRENCKYTQHYDALSNVHIPYIQVWTQRADLMAVRNYFLFYYRLNN